MDSSEKLDHGPPASPNHEAFETSAPSPAVVTKLKVGVLQLLALATVAILPYLNTLRNSFVYDDFDQVVNNPYVHNLHHLREIFTSSVWSFMGDFRGSTNYYRPMMSLGYLVCYRVFGPQAWAFHLFNIVLNAGVVILVFLLVRKLFGSSKIGLVSAYIFALHPIHSEAVNWIAAVTELELAFFFLLTFWLYLESAMPEGRTSLPIQIAMAGSFALALLSKEQALTLPMLAGVYEHFFREDRGVTPWAAKVRRYGVLWLLPIIYLGVRIHYLGRFAPSQERTGFRASDLAVSALALVGKYCWKLIWPAVLCAYYSFPADTSVLRSSALWGALALVICALVFRVLVRTNRQAAFGVVWFLVGIAPVLNVRLLASSVFAERYLYLASAGYCWILGWAAVRAWDFLIPRRRSWKWILSIAALGLACLAAGRIVVRNQDWQDDVTFYTATLKVSPNAYYMHNNLGTAYWQRGNIAAARKEWAIAYRLAPASEYVLHNLGLAAKTERDYPKARAYYLAALKIRPDYMDAHLDLGSTYRAMGHMDEAEAQFLTAERLSPLSIRVHNTLSDFYLDQHQPKRAEEEARVSLQISPTADANYDLGVAEWLDNDAQDAERALLEAISLNPSSGKAHFMLGSLYMNSGRNAEATREFRAVLRIEPANAVASANLSQLEFLENGK